MSCIKNNCECNKTNLFEPNFEETEEIGDVAECVCGAYICEEDKHTFKFKDFESSGCDQCKNEDLVEYIYHNKIDDITKDEIIRKYEKETGLKFCDDWSYMV